MVSNMAATSCVRHGDPTTRRPPSGSTRVARIERSEIRVWLSRSSLPPNPGDEFYYDFTSSNFGCSRAEPLARRLVAQGRELIKNSRVIRVEPDDFFRC